MNNLTYIRQTLLHSKLTTAVKVLSIGLGLAMSSILLVRVAYDNLIDTCFKDTDDLYQFWMQYEVGGKLHDRQIQCVYPLAGAALADMPEEIEAVCTVRNYGGRLSHNGVELDAQIAVADSLFFETMGVALLKGSPNDLRRQNTLYISDKLAEKYFGDEDPIGKTVYWQGDIKELEVRGVFRDWGKESTITANAIISISTFHNPDRLAIWDWGDSWPQYARLRKGTDRANLNDKLRQVVKQNVPDTDGERIDAFLEPIRDTYRGYPRVRHITITLSILAIAILVITALNYVLLSLSGMSHRAKAIGVYKCSGAGKGSIFAMFMTETAIIMVLAMAVAAACLWISKVYAQESIYDYFVKYVSMDRLWVIIAVVVLMFVLAALIPARIFSRVPVSQVFRRFSEHRQVWKHVLLALEFCGAGIVAGILTIVWAQYKVLTTTDVGYDADQVVVINSHASTDEEFESIVDTYSKLPFVESVSGSWGYPGFGYSGAFISENGRPLFSSRHDTWHKDYLKTMGMKLVSGREPKEGADEVIVNRTFVKNMNWDEKNVVGHRVTIDGEAHEVTGMIEDFLCASYYEPAMPFAAYVTGKRTSYIIVRLKEPGMEYFNRLKEAVQEIYPSERIYVRLMSAMNDAKYVDVKLFRTMVIIAAIIILMICGIGLTGYLSDEMRRRSREIAVRKVNGATTADIIELICHSTLFTALPSITVGTALAWYLGEVWLDQFRITLDHIGLRLALSGIITLLVIVAISISLTWSRANENPVTNLRNE